MKVTSATIMSKHGVYHVVNIYVQELHECNGSKHNLSLQVKALSFSLLNVTQGFHDVTLGMDDTATLDEYRVTHD